MTFSLAATALTEASSTTAMSLSTTAASAATALSGFASQTHDGRWIVLIVGLVAVSLTFRKAIHNFRG